MTKSPSNHTGKKKFQTRIAIPIILIIMMIMLIATTYERSSFYHPATVTPISSLSEPDPELQCPNTSSSLEGELQNREFRDDIFTFLVTTMKRIKSTWLYGRTTDRKSSFDDEYIYLSNQVRTILRTFDDIHMSRLNQLSKAVRERIVQIQNPPDCDTAKLLVYDVSGEPSGLGSKMHLMTRHFIRSIYANRTFVFKTKGWGYVEKEWEYYMQPLGKCKYEKKWNSLPLLSDKTQNERIVRTTRDIKDIDWSVPENILAVLQKLHDDPYAWWVSQFVSYAFRLQPWFEAQVQSIGNRIGFTGKVAGIQVRWGDKIGREAAKHSVNEYMDLVDTFFRREGTGGNQTRRVVYVATESSQAWKDLRSRYPHYHFIGSGYVNESRNMGSSHFVPYQRIKSALPSILTDMYFLSKSDYVVCTSSSNICRAIYELMMPEKVMPSDRLQSLDTFYLLAAGPRYRVIQDHKKLHDTGLDMEVGDELTAVYEISHRFLDGFLRGVNLRTGQKGNFPSYKTEVIVRALNSTVFEDL